VERRDGSEGVSEVLEVLEVSEVCATGFAQFPLPIWANRETLVAETLVAGGEYPEKAMLPNL
jgi:hypothetical protein